MSDLLATQKSQLLNRGLEVWKPVIAAINGYCLGGGMTLLLATDLRIAAEHATFSRAPKSSAACFRPTAARSASRSSCRTRSRWRCCCCGDAIDAQTALRWGLVNRVVPAAELMATALEFARRLARNAPLAVQAAKELALRSRDTDLATGLRLEQVMLRVLQAVRRRAGRHRGVQESARVFSGR